MWLQNNVRSGDIKVTKVGTHENLAETLTKYVGKEIMTAQLRDTYQFITTERHNLAPATEC